MSLNNMLLLMLFSIDFHTIYSAYPAFDDGTVVTIW